MRRVAIVAPQFPPSNLTAGHRARYFAMHLEKFGWKPIVVTVEASYYGKEVEPALEQLVPPGVRVIRTKALPERPIRLVGDLGIRSFWWHYRALRRLAADGEIDFVLIPIPPNYSAMLGPLIHRSAGVPYGIDYIDPWVHPWPGCERRFTKAWLAYNLGRWLEPIALRNVRLITAVAPGYYEGVRRRYSWLQGVEFEAMPYGAEERDFALLDRLPRTARLFNPRDGLAHVVYAGALLPNAYRTLDLLFSALAQASGDERASLESLRLHFIGTGRDLANPQSRSVASLAAGHGVGHLVEEHVERIPYLDVIAHLKQATAVMVLGSTEPHYTPSKVFQALLSRRPVFAMLHGASTGLEILRAAGARHVVPLYAPDVEEGGAAQGARIRAALGAAVSEGRAGDANFNPEVLAQYSAERSAQMLAQALDRTVASA